MLAGEAVPESCMYYDVRSIIDKTVFLNEV